MKQLAVKTVFRTVTFCLAAGLCCAGSLHGAVIFEAHSPYHEVRVLDEQGARVLKFNAAEESRMSLANPLQGHFEYTEYFHTPWVWNRDIHRVLMIGLGGGSIQRAYLHYYTNVVSETVEIDPIVVQVARKYFKVAESPRLRIRNQDGRVFLQRSVEAYDVIIMDAYTTSRYGSSIPPHLATVEFFTLASSHLTTNGVLAYNVISRSHGSGPDILGAFYRTMKRVFPQVYLFQAQTSLNIVLVATKSPTAFGAERVQREGAELIRAGTVRLPDFAARLRAFDDAAPRSAANSPILTDDHAPVEKLMASEGLTR